MNKIAGYLRSHLHGEVVDNKAMCEYFSTDASVLEMQPSIIIYPQSTNDVRKVARFSWQLAEKGHILPITPRGGGTDTSGAALGSGIIVVFPAHLHGILEFDIRQKLIRVQPGVSVQTLQTMLNTHGLYVPAFESIHPSATVGGSIANNTAGATACKYGAMGQWVEKLEVVLANGELIQTGRLSRKDVAKKKGLTTLEGELYRVVDGIGSEREDLLETYYGNLRVNRDVVGYNMRDVRRRDGSIDLTPLFIGSQGTLGIITEVIVKAETYNPRSSFLVASFATLDALAAVLPELRLLRPSRLEMVDQHLIDIAIREKYITLPDDLLTGDESPAALLFIEFDDGAERLRHKKIKKTKKQLMKYTERYIVAEDDELEEFSSLRRMPMIIGTYNQAGKVAVPIMGNATVPDEKFQDMLQGIYDLFSRHHLPVAVWGDVAEVVLHVRPLLDLSKLGDRQKVFKLIDEYSHLVVTLGGSIAAQSGDGRLYAPYAKLQTGDELTRVFTQLRQGFDMYGTLNPGVKTDADAKQLVNILRKTYSNVRWAEYATWEN